MKAEIWRVPRPTNLLLTLFLVMAGVIQVTMAVALSLKVVPGPGISLRVALVVVVSALGWALAAWAHHQRWTRLTLEAGGLEIAQVVVVPFGGEVCHRCTVLSLDQVRGETCRVRGRCAELELALGREHGLRVTTPRQHEPVLRAFARRLDRARTKGLVALGESSTVRAYKTLTGLRESAGAPP